VDKKMTWIISIALFFFLLTHGSLVYSASYEESLKGLTEIFVWVEKLDPDIEDKAALTEKQIQTDVELKLREAGIQVVSKEESFKIPGRPYLYVSLNALHDSTRLFFAYTIYISINQEVYLERNPEIRVRAYTWDETIMGLIGEDKVGRIRDKIKDSVDGFIKDYLSVNPKGEK